MIAETSKRALETVNRREYYGRIRNLMQRYPKRDWCITEVGWSLHEQNSTISARLNEMRSYGWIEKVGERKSRITGVTSTVYRLKK